jgi:hypothetical protein
MAKLILEHPHSGIIKQAPVGYSWATLFFPSLPALFRGDFKGFFFQAILDCLIIPILIFPRIYNKQYIRKLLTAGYKVRSAEGIHLDAAKQKLGINMPQLEADDA